MDSRDVDEVLAQLTRQRRWLAHFYGGRTTPHLIAFTFEWRGTSCADVVLIHSEHKAAAYRTPVDARTDILRPDLVCWSYEGLALWVMRAVLSIPPPTHADAPLRLYEPTELCRVPDTEERPLVIRPTLMVT